jgi:hypothetical protein
LFTSLLFEEQQHRLQDFRVLERALGRGESAQNTADAKALGDQTLILTEGFQHGNSAGKFYAFVCTHPSPGMLG